MDLPIFFVGAATSEFSNRLAKISEKTPIYSNLYVPSELTKTRLAEKPPLLTFVETNPLMYAEYPGFGWDNANTAFVQDSWAFYRSRTVVLDLDNIGLESGYYLLLAHTRLPVIGVTTSPRCIDNYAVKFCTYITNPQNFLEHLDAEG